MVIKFRGPHAVARPLWGTPPLAAGEEEGAAGSDMKMTELLLAS